MSDEIQRYFNELTFQNIIEINRHRAIIIAEYMCFSRMLLSGRNELIIVEEEWRDLVREIEFHISHNEENRIVVPTVDFYEPKGFFFTSTHPIVRIFHYKPPEPKVYQIWMPTTEEIENVSTTN